MASPVLTLPASQGSTVRVSLLHAGRTTVPTAVFVKQQIPGHDVLDVPCYSFLIENDNLGKKVLYDLGIMKAWMEKLPPSLISRLENHLKATIHVTKDVPDQLTAASLPLTSIDSIIWSHHHFDHTGDPSLFPKSTSLVVGPGFKSNKRTYPGYPENPDAAVGQDVLEGRELIELDFADVGLEIGGFKTMDFFGDGSFYLLHATGHTHDHICGLARTSDTKFVFMGGDAAHHPGEFRPNPRLPLPEYISPSPFKPPHSSSICPGSLFESIHPCASSGGDYTKMPFYSPNPTMNVSLPDAEVTLSRMQLFDASPDVLLVIAHDASLLDVLPFYPEGELTGWEETGVRDFGTWRFLKDFGVAVEFGKRGSK